MTSVGLAAVAAFLGLGSLLGLVVVSTWLSRGAVPPEILDAPLAIVMWHALTMALSWVAAPVAAIQLIRQRNSGRILAVAILANDALHTAAGALLGLTAQHPAVGVAIGLDVLVIVFLLSPSAVDACSGSNRLRARLPEVFS